MQRAAVAFGRVLRRAGIAAGTDRTLEFVRALEEVGMERRQSVYWAGRATFCSRPEDLKLYDAAFRAFWDEMSSGELPPVSRRKERSAVDLDSVQPPKKTVESDPEGEEAVHLRYSPVEVLRSKDFALYTAEEFEELRRLLADLRLSGALRRSRRLEPARRGRFDQRRTLRGALRTGGEALRHRFRAPRWQPRRVVLLCDISGSMAQYSRALMRFLHAGVISGARLEAYAMGTRLTRITRELASKDPDRALSEAADAVRDWSGGTRLGDAMKEFVDRWGQRGMARGSVVVILSDGWDRGDLGVLREQMARLKRLAYKVIWVNPLKAAPGYRPLAGGMAAALPYVDVFLSGHNFESLEELANAIASTIEEGDRA
ncbi:VWA domain-containing protein [Rubrobacter taiwanensis]|uniref:VWA domain-containing protein n=1 Tax=Rubrobacter taiwanensis TaxID=185139 RepID=A0A4V2NVW3_9ACTN|nr:VWA domain-containing protein [Rubrobacter taiwanensis]TCJ15002.1 VWA domain-containing protein [Rubrobacter taiwanensis]